MAQSGHGIALDRGVKEDSPEYFAFLDGFLRQQGAHAPSPHAAPAPPSEPPPMHAALMPEPMPPPMAHAHADIERTDEPEPEQEHSMAAMVSAPVSRGEQAFVEGELSVKSTQTGAQEAYSDTISIMPRTCSAVTARRHSLHSNVCISGRPPTLGTVRAKRMGRPQDGQVTSRSVLIVSMGMTKPLTRAASGPCG